MKNYKRVIFRVTAITLGLLVVCALVGTTDLIMFWYDQYNNGTVRRIRDRTEKGPGIHESVPQGMLPSTGLRLRRLNKEVHYDAISKQHILIETNALGYRSPHVAPKETGEFRTLVLGDSITLGASCVYDETYPAFMEQKLGHRVINAGISGISLNCSLKVLLETGLLTQPDVVVVAMYLNDAAMSPTYEPLHGFWGQSPLARRAHKVSRYKQFEKDTRKLYEEFSGNNFPDSQPEGAWRTDPIAFEYEKAKASCDWGSSWYPWAWEQLRMDMEQFVKVRDKYEFSLVFVLFPCTFQVESEFIDDTPQQFWQEIVDELNVPHLDLLPMMREKYHAAGVSMAYDHCHLTPAGNEFVATVISDFLVQMGL